MPVSRRTFLAGAVASGAAAKVGGLADVAGAVPQPKATPPPPPGSSGIENIVVVCMENRSFDHFLGWVPRANGRQAGLSYLDDEGVSHDTHHLESFTGCGFNDPDHSYLGGRRQLNGGAMDGFRRGRNDDYALGYYGRDDLAMTSQLVDNFTICDQWHSSIMAPTFPNRLYTHSASTDRVSNTYVQCTLPTIWDRLAAAGVSASYYYSDVPFLVLYGDKYVPISKPLDAFFMQAAAGVLPAYSYIDPSFFGEAQNDDHPHADIRRGQNFVGRIVQALLQSPQWSSTVLIVTYDEWGGFFDHVVPPRRPDDVETPGDDPANPDHSQTGFRVPAYIISPFARRGGVAKRLFDHASILKLVEWRFGLKPLSRRDRAANNPAGVLDFSAPNLEPPELVLPPDPGHQSCVGQEGLENPDSLWRDLASSPLAARWRT
jgi:phospholipase C